MQTVVTLSGYVGKGVEKALAGEVERDGAHVCDFLYDDRRGALDCPAEVRGDVYRALGIYASDVFWSKVRGTRAEFPRRVVLSVGEL